MSHLVVMDLAPNVTSTQSHPREGVDIQFSESGTEASEQWAMGGWLIQFIRLPANERLALDPSSGRIFIKVIVGALSNIDMGPFANAREVRNTLVASSHVVAGDDDTLFAVFTETPSAPANVTDMAQLTLVGPNADAFRWRSFQDRFGDFMSGFDGADAYMSGGFHLLDSRGTEITYVNLWTAGKGVNLTTHDHGNEPHPSGPAFAEVHWVFNNGTGRGGMYSADAPDGLKTDVYPMQRGDEHGPFFFVDHETKRPALRKNGSVDYPWHGWEAGVDDEPGQAYDVVAAFETSPGYVRI